MTIEERANDYSYKAGRLGAYQGYLAGATEQKEIDALTWQDIRCIVEIADDERLLQHCSENGLSQEQYYTEVLKRFNESKEDKI